MKHVYFINLSIVNGVIIRHLFEWRRNMERIIDTFWWPLVDLTAWGLASFYLKKTNPNLPNLTAIFLGGIIFWVFIQNVQRDINMPILSEAWNRNLINLFTSPLRLREFILGTMILGFIKIVITLAVMYILARLFYGFDLFMLGGYLIFAAVNLFLMGWWVGFMIAGLIFRFGYRMQSFAWAFVFVLYPFSAVIYPVTILPLWAQVIAMLVPSSYVFENMRAVIYQARFSPTQIWFCFFLNLLYLLLSIIFMKYMFHKALEKGRLIKLN